MRGVVTMFNRHRRHGFIHTNEGEYYLSQRDWLEQAQLPIRSEIVEFEPEETSEGKKAMRAKRVINI